LSLDNNLTDIEEDENEGNTARRMSNVNSSPTDKAAVANKTPSGHQQIPPISVSALPVIKSNEQQPQESTTPQPPQSPKLP